MVYAKVQYDAYNGTFKLMDRTLGKVLEDDGVYDLAIPFGFEEGFDRETFAAMEACAGNA